MATEASIALGPPLDTNPKPPKDAAPADDETEKKPDPSPAVAEPPTKVAADTVTPASPDAGKPAAAPVDADIRAFIDSSAKWQQGAAAGFEQRDKSIAALGQQIASRPAREPPPTPQLQPPPKLDQRSGLEAATSLASIIGMLGSLKTRAPLTSSLNAAAGAMNAIRKRDVEDFELQSKQWKEQNDNVLKQAQLDYERYKSIFESDKYSDEQKLNLIRLEAQSSQDRNMFHAAMTQDITLAEKIWYDRQSIANQQSQIAASMTPQKMLMGHYDRENPKATAQQRAEFYNSMQPRLSSAANLDRADRHVLYQSAKTQKETELGRPLTPDEDLALLNQFTMSAKDAAVAKRVQSSKDIWSGFDNWQKIPGNDKRVFEDFITDFQRVHGTVDPAVKADVMERKMKVAETNQDRLSASDYEKQRHNYATEDLNTQKYGSTEERKKAELEEKTRHQKEMERLYGQRASSSVSAQRADAISSKLEEIRNGKPGKPGHEPTADEKARVVQSVTKGGLTGNRAEVLESQIDHLDDSLNTIDSVVGTLDKYAFPAGVAGKGARGAERVGNILGSNNTDRVQMMRDIERLQLMAPRQLLGATGRPLSAEESKISDIIGGLSVGDTAANTRRSLMEIKALYEKSRGDTYKRLTGTWEPSADSGLGTGGSAGGGASPGGKKPSWQQAPLVKVDD